MFLKRIVLRGFKSFADRTEFDFGSGLTCIVGPNGCGKSNVLDALRWVLGEQKPRTLRGAKMADVIFVGSRSRKPASLAQVELTFDNRASFLASDESEVVISRVLYAGGQSEYRLNGNLCRLKDVRNLFLDTGVGVDAYSIIEQGRVDVLLASSPLERREIFEEAAGISRYKVRRTEAQRKLERTQNNLLRLSDVIEELEKRLRSVKLAAGKARSFQQYDARLRELRSSFSLAEYHDLEQARLTAYARAEERGAELQTHRTELARSDADAAQLEHEVQDLDEQIQAVEAGLLTRQTEQSALGERIAQTQRRLTELGAIRTRRRSQATDLADSVAALRERIAAEDATLGELIEAVERSSEQITQLEQARTAAELASAENRQALEREKAAAFEAARRCALLHNEQQNLVQQQQRLASQADGLTQRQQQLETEQERLARQHGQLTERGEELEREVNDLSSALRQTEARLAELATEGNELDKRIGAEKEARSATLSRLELLEDMDRRHEGVDQGTRSVLAWGESGECTGSVLGLVADVFQIDDPRLSILQTVLGTFENHLIVRDTYAFLAELKQRAELAGPVRVLALDRVPQEQPRTSYHDAPGFVARAADWVRCSAEFRPLADSLLGRTIVVDCVERALACAAGAPQGYTFVTLAGDTVDTHGRMTIGATKATAGLISRKAEIRQLRGELDEIETRLERTVRQRAELERAASDVQMQRGALVDQIAAAQREHADQRAALTRVDDARQRVRREAALVGSETAAAQRALAELAQKSRELQSAAHAAQEAQDAHEAQVAMLAKELAARDADVGCLAQKLTEALVEVGRRSERRAAGAEAVGELRARLERLCQALSQAEREAEEAAEQIETAELELDAARTRRSEVARECERHQAEVLRLRENRHELRQRLETARAAARALHGQIEELDAALRECEVALRETEVRKENLVARVQDDLALDLAALYASYEHEEQDWEAIKEEIEDLRQKIARLGNINLDALAELDELSPRYDNLIAQRDDLEASVARLEALIVELDEASRARFAATFEEVRVQFQELFRKLFGGGKADIILEDPEQPLECGIEIIARPPGKEPQSISLLSGGERTMTAVALLLAIFKSKPSPFAILDEVDAALDESNIERFNNVLQEFLTHSQFIVITHNKRTMQCADMLYGVTMEELGVSKRVSVRFDGCVETPHVA